MSDDKTVEPDIEMSAWFINWLACLTWSSCVFGFPVYGMVPFLNAILGTMLPMLSVAKQDNMKWVFSSGKHFYLLSICYIVLVSLDHL